MRCAMRVSAFQEFDSASTDLPRAIAHCRIENRKKRQPSLLQQSAAAAVNVLRSCTLGLGQLYAEINAAQKFGASVVTRYHSDFDSGRLMYDASSLGTFPLLSKRYKITSLLGEGTFSQIFKASYLQMGLENNYVAIKVMKIGYDILGYRESTYLKYFASKSCKGSQHFVAIKETFQFEHHFCMAMELFDTTLLHFLHITLKDDGASTTGGSAPSSSNSNSAQRVLSRAGQPLLQPKVIRHAMWQPSGAPGPSPLPLAPRPLDAAKIRKIAMSLVSALYTVRKEGAIHADVKPENCFLRLPAGAEVSADALRDVADLPADFDVRLGDFGNSILLSEASSYYGEFDIQSLPYRAPEVLFGVPFGPQVDMWSLGMVLIEVCTGRPLLVVSTREEALRELELKLISPRMLRFAGGRYADLLGGGEDCPVPVRVNFSSLIIAVKRLLNKRLQGGFVPADLTHFVAGLIHPDPDLRLTALDALQHPFLACSLPIPLSLIGGREGRGGRGAAAMGLSVLNKEEGVEGGLAVSEAKEDEDEDEEKEEDSDEGVAGLSCYRSAYATSRLGLGLGLGSETKEDEGEHDKEDDEQEQEQEEEEEETESEEECSVPAKRVGEVSAMRGSKRARASDHLSKLRREADNFLSMPAASSLPLPALPTAPPPRQRQRTQGGAGDTLSLLGKKKTVID